MDDEIAALLADYEPEIRAIALRARDLVLGAVPGLVEQVDRPAQLLGYGRDRSYKRSICAIVPQRRYVNLMFAAGVRLPDPERLLVGTGKLARHVRLESLSDVDRPGIRALLDRAAEVTP